MKVPRKSVSERVDWAALRERLARSFGPASNDAADADRTLRERAARLSTPLEPERAQGATVSLVCFERAARRYAIEARFVIEVLKCGRLSRVPRAQPALLGVTNLRGDVLSVFDLALLEGVTGSAPAEPGLVVLGEAQPDLALLVDGACEVLSLPRADFSEPRRLGTLPQARFVLGVSAEARVLIDGEAVLRDRRTFVARPMSSEPLERIES